MTRLNGLGGACRPREITYRAVTQPRGRIRIPGLLLFPVFEGSLGMPIYEYRCKSCGDVVEVIQRFQDRPLRKCSECGGRLEKLISRSSFQLKGGGWYASGYSKSSGSKKSSSSDSSKSNAKSAGKEKKSSSGSSKMTPKSD